MINRTSQNLNNRHLLMIREMEMLNRAVKGMLTLESRVVPGDRGGIRSPARREEGHAEAAEVVARLSL